MSQIACRHRKLAVTAAFSIGADGLGKEPIHCDKIFAAAAKFAKKHGIPTGGALQYKLASIRKAKLGLIPAESCAKILNDPHNAKFIKIYEREYERKTA